LYDTELSAYMSLGDLAERIREGRQVKVIDAQTEEDVTAYILTQILLEEAKSKNLLLPVPLLTLFIQYGEGILGEFFEKYLEQVLNNYVAYKKTADDQFKAWLDLGFNFTAMSPFESFFGAFKDKDKPQ
jgi:polyhydroxyalkanoate synthesis repressor PhaR